MEIHIFLKVAGVGGEPGIFLFPFIFSPLFAEHYEHSFSFLNYAVF
jgi:hypothetical protein